VPTQSDTTRTHLSGSRDFYDDDAAARGRHDR
jgi:hypothetical protein